jgi:thiamine-monophosphate kinase
VARPQDGSSPDRGSEVSRPDPRPVARSEDAWIGAISKRFPAGPRVRVGIGHDAAVVAFDGRDVVLKTDTVIDGVDFRLAECGPRLAGRKALAVVVSDFAAMGAVPRACVVSTVLPRGIDFATFDGLAEGLAGAASEFGCDVVGGDTSVADGPLFLAVAAVGEPGPHGTVTRSGAKPGMRLSVTGPLGGSILGRHLRFAPRLRESHVLLALGIPKAMMDLSDGLSTDLPRLCAMSGVGAVLDADRIPAHDDARRMADGVSALEHACNDGEDFELLLAHEPLTDAQRRGLAAEGVTLVDIGAVTAERGVVAIDASSGRKPLVARGYDHLAPRG